MVRSASGAVDALDQPLPDPMRPETVYVAGPCHNREAVPAGKAGAQPADGPHPLLWGRDHGHDHDAGSAKES